MADINQRNIKTAVIPIAGLGTRFLPISKLIPKEFLPVGFKPIIHYIVEEAISAGVKKIIFVVSPNKKEFFSHYIKNYFLEDKESFKFLKEKEKIKAIRILNNIPKPKINFVVQSQALGDGDAILRAKKKIDKGPFLVLFGDDISFNPWGKLMAVQLTEMFQKINSPLLCLYKKQKKDLFAYGVPKISDVKKKKNLYKIIDIIEKPKGNPPSRFALVGKYILTPEIFYYLEKIKHQSRKKEVILADALKLMIKDKKDVYGLTAKGEWLECGTKEKWLRNFKYLSKRE